MKNLFKYFFTLGFVTIVGCSRQAEKKEQPAETKPEVVINVPEFNADSAYQYVSDQCAFGPRVPNTVAHYKCSEYLISQMKRWSDTVYVQSGKLTTFDKTSITFKNIIGVFNPQLKNRILLFAHWDTRPWADQDTKDKNKPGLGANDGASGVGILMEIARKLHEQKLNIGVDLALFDAEDWGKEGGGDEAEDSYALGTQYWAKNTHVPGYAATFGILLDMTGGKNAQFRWEGGSKQKASFVLDKIWNAAGSLGYSPYFLYEDGGWVIDDHVYVNRINIPAVDIISSDRTTRSGFPAHWHTHNDNMDVIDQKTLKAVGQTLLKVIATEAK